MPRYYILVDVRGHIHSSFCSSRTPYHESQAGILYTPRVGQRPEMFRLPNSHCRHHALQELLIEKVDPHESAFMRQSQDAFEGRIYFPIPSALRPPRQAGYVILSVQSKLELLAWKGY